jgi:hypothetical protein
MEDLKSEDEGLSEEELAEKERLFKESLEALFIKNNNIPTSSFYLSYFPAIDFYLAKNGTIL